MSDTSRRWRPRRRVPHVQQLESADCGAACLAMVLAYWGHETTVSRVREVLSLGGAGADAATLLEGAQQFGLRGRGVKLEVEGLPHLPQGSILHWSFGHWIVFDRFDGRVVRVVDPERGRRALSLEKFHEKFTGVALLFTPDERFTPQRQRRRLVRPYLRRLLSDRRLLLQVLAMTGLLQALGLLLPAMTGVVVDRVVPLADYSLLLVVGVGSAAAIGMRLVSALLRTYLLVELRTRLDFQLATRFLAHLASLPYPFFQKRSQGDLMMRVSSNERIREFLASAVLSSLLDASLAVLSLCAILAISPAIALLAALLGTARVTVLLLCRRALTESMAAQLDATARSQSYLAEILAGIETLKASGREGRAVQHWTSLYVDELDEAARRARLEGTAAAIIDALDAASPLAVLGLGAMVTLDGTLTLGTMLAAVALATAFLTPLTHLVDAGLQLSLLQAYLERAEDVLESEPEQRPGERGLAPRLRGEITLRGVSFRYGSQQPLVLDNIDLAIAPGQTVAIVGASGSGKSTLANLLLGLYVPTGGEIRFDGRSIHELDLASLRRQVGVVSQHPYLFAGTIRENITLDDDAVPLSRCVEAARAAALHDDILRLPMRYQSQLPDRGASLSGGQRQRLALARALLHRPAVLLLDEATSALDARTEAEITASVERLRCTRIVIAHRLSTIARADLIVVLDRGRIAEVGKHAELLAKGQVYAGLVRAQAAWGAA